MIKLSLTYVYFLNMNKYFKAFLCELCMECYSIKIQVSLLNVNSIRIHSPIYYVFIMTYNYFLWYIYFLFACYFFTKKGFHQMSFFQCFRKQIQSHFFNVIKCIIFVKICCKYYFYCHQPF